MIRNSIYQDLYEMYSNFPNLYMVKDTFLELLCAQFTPEEAELATKVGFHGGKIDYLEQKTGIDRGKLRKMLNTMADKGTMWVDPGVDDPTYKVMGIGGPGLVETGGWGNIRFPHSVELMKKLHYFEVDFAKKLLPAVGNPVARVWLNPAALPDDAKSEENIAEQIRNSAPYGVSTCSCRLPHWITDPGNHCIFPLETCMFMGEMTKWGLEHGMCREINYEEALDILLRSNKVGLVHTHDPNTFICNCCNDCCVLLMGHYITGAKILQPSEFMPRFDESTCSACGTCAKRCPVDAIIVENYATVDLDKCLGCGVCFPTCPTESIHFERRV